MNHSASTSHRTESDLDRSRPASSRGLVERLARRVILSRLGKIERGTIELVDGSDCWTFGSSTSRADPKTLVTVRNPRSYADMAFGGSIGAAEAYMAGHWTCDDLTDLVRILVLNRDILDDFERGLGLVTAPLQKLFHALRRNSRSGSRRNIQAHYDLGNDFFSCFLDDTMMYSCAFFERADSTLVEASTAKNDRICRKLDLQPNDHLLEVGTGWGGFALHAAGTYGCRVTTATISREQYEFASRRIHEAGLSDRVTVLLEDYRDLKGRYDKLVSIEMIEAVGHAFYGTYFKQCADLLEPNGMMLLQAITIEDRRYELAKRSVDFIQRYIFPGSCIPSVTAICDTVTSRTDLQLYNLEDIGAHYPKTLRTWRTRLMENAQRIHDLGFSEEFLRMWEYYFAYCEGGFLERSISDVQMLFVKPGYRPSVEGCSNAYAMRAKARC